MSEAISESYIEYAKEINNIARMHLELGKPITERRVGFVGAKIALGLAFQAAELAGKSILCSFGQDPIEIRRRHPKHRLDLLLGEAHMLVLQEWPEGAPDLDDFLSFVPQSEEGNATSLGAFLMECRSNGILTDTRGYLYPDESTFIGPVPYYSVVALVDHLISSAEQIKNMLNIK